MVDAARFRSFSHCVGILLTLVMTGCGSEGTVLVPVEGIVTLDGAPLRLAQVEFQPEHGSPSYGETDTQGHFELHYSLTRLGALLGTHTVRVTTGGEVTDPVTDVTRNVRERVPPQFNVQSTLKREVTEEENYFELHLKSD